MIMSRRCTTMHHQLQGTGGDGCTLEPRSGTGTRYYCALVLRRAAHAHAARHSALSPPLPSSFSPSSSTSDRDHLDAVSDTTVTVTVSACVDRSFHSRPTSRLVHRWAHAYGSGEDQNLIQILIRIHQCTCGPVTRRDGARVSLQLWRGVSCRGVAWKN